MPNPTRNVSIENVSDKARPSHAQRRNGGIGRHEGLKIPWPEMAVRVRVPLAALFLNSLIFYYEKLSRSHAHSVFTVSTFILL